jgi:hypothetical protein
MYTQQQNFNQPRFRLPLPENNEFPFYALPEQLLSVLTEGFAITKSPPELILVSMLGAMSLAVQGVAKVSSSEHNSGSCGIFTLVIAEPSEGKSSCERLFFKPFEDWENMEKQNAELNFVRYLSEHNTWMTSLKLIKKAINKEVQDNATL